MEGGAGMNGGNQDYHCNALTHAAVCIGRMREGVGRRGRNEKKKKKKKRKKEKERKPNLQQQTVCTITTQEFQGYVAFSAQRVVSLSGRLADWQYNPGHGGDAFIESEDS